MKFFQVVLLLGLLPSCATIVSDSEYSVLVDSNPTGAAISVASEDGTNVFEGTTPTTLSLPANAGYFNGETYTINAVLDGYSDVEAILDSSLDGWYWGNLLFGGILGFLIIDPATGDMWKLPGELTIDMTGEAVAP